MQAALTFPNLSPEVFSVEFFGYELALRWYALAYILGLILGWRIIVALMRRPGLWQAGKAPMAPERAEDLMTMVVLGVILGGRLGFVLAYQPGYYLANPLEILKVWEGGMSFHGGFLGAVLAGLWFCRRQGVSALALGDAMALAATPGVFLGRLSNFVNAELWGRPTTMPWGVIFPGEAAQDCPGIEGLCARHPSQLYEAGLEGLILGLVLVAVLLAGGLRRPGLATGVFVGGYAMARFAVEFLRQPDAQFIDLGNPLGLALELGGYGLTMGQLLSLPMLAAGLWLIGQAGRR